MGNWGTQGFKEKECGTTACAAGWATVAFPKGGLVLVDTDGGADLAIEYRRRGRSALDSYVAVAAFFDIDVDASDFLFNPDCYEDNSKRHVVARIRKMVKTGQYTDEDDDVQDVDGF